jgi:hypothetical protein
MPTSTPATSDIDAIGRRDYAGPAFANLHGQFLPEPRAAFSIKAQA